LNNWFTTDNLVNSVPLRIYYKANTSKITSDFNGLIINEPLLTNLGQAVIIDASGFEIKFSRFEDGQSGLFLYNASNGTIYSSSIVNVNDYAIHFGQNSKNVTIVNTSLTIPFSAKAYFKLDEYSNVTTINTTFDKSKVFYKIGSNLTIKWYLHIKAKAQVTSVLQANANVKVSDRFGTLVYNGTTNTAGQARFIECTERVNGYKRTRVYNDYNVSVFKLGYQLGYAIPEVNMDGSKWVTIGLFKNRPPTLSGSIKPSITHNRTPTISWIHGEDLDGDKLKYWVYLWNFLSPGDIIELNSTFKNEYIVQSTLSYGSRYVVNVTATDLFGGWSNTLLGSFDVVNRPPSLPVIKILPDPSDKRPSKNEDLNCTIVNESEDKDSNPVDIIKYSFRWYKNGEYQENLSVINTTKIYNILQKQYTSTGDIWTCRVTATDGYVVTQSVSDSAIIRNTQPIVKKDVPNLNMDEDTVDSTTINLLEIFFDEDFEPLTYDFAITGKNITLQVFPENGTVIVTPAKDWNGAEVAVFTASDEEASVYITTTIKVLPVPDPPTADIILPRTDSFFIHNLTTGISFVGVFDDPDLLYGDKINSSWVSDLSGVLGYGSQLDGVMLPIGDHRIEYIARDSTNLIARDSIVIHVISLDFNDTNITIPEVKLLSPLNSHILKTKSATLNWMPFNLNASDSERVLYDVYLDTSDPPGNLLITEWLGTNITTPELEDNTTYFWTVIPYLEILPGISIEGICVDLVWNFTIDLNFTPIFGVKLNMTEPEIVLNTGQSRTFNFTIMNTGNVVDKYVITIKFLQNNELINFTKLDIDNITLQSLFQSQINITFNIPLNYSSTKDTMLVIAASVIGSATTNLTRNITIINPSLPSIVKETPDEVPTGLINMLLGFIVVILIILVVLIILIIRLMLWVKRQQNLNYPVKTKQIIRKDRSLAGAKAENETESDKDEADEAESTDEAGEVKDSSKSATSIKAAKTAKPVVAKPAPGGVKTKPAAHGIAKGAKLAAVTPIRLSSLQSKDIKSKLGKEQKNDESDEEVENDD
jgi:hypothetical protein